MNDICQAETCARVAQCHAAGLVVCLMHYKRWKKTGQFGRLRPNMRPARAARGICTIDDCGRQDDGPDGFCKMHATRARRHGDPNKVVAVADRSYRIGGRNPSWTGDKASYGAVHLRLRASRGRASAYDCVQCGAPAKQWSYGHADPAERTAPEGNYSIDLGHYQPRCVPCHKRLDLEVLRGLQQQTA